VERVFRRWVLPGFERTQAAGALAKLGRPEGVLHLFERARKRWTMDRALALELLGEVKAAGAKERLTEILKNPKDPNRGAAARGLGKLKAPELSGVLAEVMLDAQTPDDLRLDIAESLLAMKAKDARAPMERALMLLQCAEAKAELRTLIEECPWS
jgi:hypothetical protein